MHRRADLEKVVIPSEKIADGFVQRAYINEGFYYLADGEKTLFLDDNGKEYKGLLDADGGPLPEGKPVVFMWFGIRKAD
jgi:hypothetical protein